MDGTMVGFCDMNYKLGCTGSINCKNGLYVSERADHVDKCQANPQRCDQTVVRNAVKRMATSTMEVVLSSRFDEFACLFHFRLVFCTDRQLRCAASLRGRNAGYC